MVTPSRQALPGVMCRTVRFDGRPRVVTPALHTVEASCRAMSALFCNAYGTGTAVLQATYRRAPAPQPKIVTVAVTL